MGVGGRIGLWVQALQIRQGANGPVGHGAFFGLKGKGQAHRQGERGDVVEQDDRIDPETGGQHGDLGGPFDILRKGEEVLTGTDALEFGIPPTGLAHGPYRDPFNGFTPGGP